MNRCALFLLVALVVACGGGGNKTLMDLSGDGAIEVPPSGECTPGALTCYSNAVWQCNPAGSDWMEHQPCLEGTVCYDGACCTPASCEGVVCGDAGCGLTCGECGEGTHCDEGKCVAGACIPDCESAACGDDGCGGTCGECQGVFHCCQGLCCQASCDGKECGDDGCCGVCGFCTQGGTCQDGKCCQPECTGKECGDDGCGGTCGECDGALPCFDGKCCQPKCAGKECGDDGCGGVCGVCEPWLSCSADSKCANLCTESCSGKDCGPDACAGQCGACGNGLQCTDLGLCVGECTPSCEGKQCGSDGCWGACGAPCTPGTFCDKDGLCKVLTDCKPECTGKACGPDGCGGDCGPCAGDGQLCTVDGHCESWCSSCQFDEVCTSLDFEAGNLVGWHIEGDGRVVGSLGDAKPVQGDYMLLVSSAIGSVGEVAFENCIQAEGPVDRVHFRWKFYSEEFMEYCSAVEADSFTVYLEKGGKTLLVFTADVHDLCPPDACNGCGKLYSVLSPSDVDLDQGDAFMTDWVEGEGKVLGFITPGETFNVRVRVEDASGPLLDTLVLVDDIQFLFCTVDCAGKECGDNGCGGTCGACQEGFDCVEGKCACPAQCEGKVCGDDGCGGSCGQCKAGYACADGLCVPCVPDCAGKQCGDDGCGGSCGKCGAGFYCTPQGKCLPDCTPDCDGKQCGDDGCGGSCGDCEDENVCTKDKCNTTTYQCVFMPAEGECDDGNPDTDEDHCVNGKCEGE